MASDPTAGRSSEVEVCAEAEVLDPVLVELPIRRMAVEVFEQELELAGEQHAVDLDTGTGRDVGAPVGLLMLLDVDRGDGPPARRASGPWAIELQAVLDRPRVEAGRVLAEEPAAAAVHTSHLEHVVGQLEIDALVTEVDSIGAGPEQELVSQMAALMEDAQLRREIFPPEAQRQRDQVVGVHQVERGGIQVEDGEDTRLEAELPEGRAQLHAVDGEALSEADGAHVAELWIAEVVLPGGREVRPARVGDQRLEDDASGEQTELLIGG